MRSYIENYGEADKGITTNGVVFLEVLMMSNKKKMAIFFCVALGAGTQANAQAANNVATVIIDNKTTASAGFTYEYIAGTASPVFGSVPAQSDRLYEVTSFADSISGMRFVYTSGSKQCRFNISHAVSSSGNVPAWKKDADSIGSSKARCMVNVERISAQMPYDYTVRFTIQ